MDQIKFNSQNKNETEFAKETRKRVRTYLKENDCPPHGNFKLYIKALILLSLYLAPFVIILFVPMSAWAALALAVLMGIGESGVGMSVMHDGAHGSFSSKNRVNKLAASTMYLMGSTTFNWKIQHNLKHHTFTNVFKYDGDISSTAVVRLSERAPLKKFHRYQHIYAFPLYGLMTLFRLFGEITILLDLNKRGITAEHNYNPKLEVFKMVLTKIIYLILIIGLPLLLTDFSIWQILLGFAAMHVVAGMIMSTVFQLAHVVQNTERPEPDEDNAIHMDWFVHQLCTTADFGRENGLLSKYVGGLDYQIEHHLFPYISHVHYPAIAPIVEKTAKEYGFTYNLNPSFLHALSSHYRRLRYLGREKG